MALFGFGAFSTPVGSLIEQATDNSASAANLALHLQICDEINNSDSGPKEAVAAIRKRLTGSAKNYHIINLTLTVLETCVKNCGIRFHSKIAQKDFLKDLMGVIQPKNNPPTIVRERVLGLIQYWVDAFKDKPQLYAVANLYGQLKEDGVEFPPLDLDSLTPVDTPDRATTDSTTTGNRGHLELVQPSAGDGGRGSGRTHRRSQRPIGPLKPEQVAKLLSELDVVRKNLDVMNEILIENEPGKEVEDDYSLMQELHTTLTAMQERVTELIGRVTDEIVLESLLQINDELNSSFTRYDRHMKNRQVILSPQFKAGEETTSFSPPPTAPRDESLPPISYPSLDVPPSYEGSGNGTAAVGQLIDLGQEMDSTTQGKQQEGGGADDVLVQLADLGITGNVPPVTNPMLEKSDEFDIFAQSRLAYSTGGSTYEDNIQQQGTSLSSAVHRQPQPTEEPMFNNLGSWLSEQPSQTQSQPQPQPQPQTSDDQVTSAEFDQFLAERASKAKHRPQMQTQEETTDTMFEL